MAVNKKKLSRAKADAACKAIQNLLDRTEHDDRLNFTLRSLLYASWNGLELLTKELREDENGS